MIPINEIKKKVGGRPKIKETLIKLGYKPVKLRIGGQGKRTWVVSEEAAQKVIDHYNGSNPLILSERSEPLAVISNAVVLKDRVEDRIAKEREGEGWIAFRAAQKGMPDLILLKRRTDGGFDVQFEEVKGPGDSLHKEQYEMHELLKSKGIIVKLTWL